MALTPSLVGTPTLGGHTLGADPICAVPTGAGSGHKLLAFCAAAAGGSTWTPPAGWSAHPQSLGGQTPLFYRDSPGGEPANYTFVVSGAGNAGVIMVAIKDWYSVDDVDGLIVASGNITLPSVDAVRGNTMLLDMVIRISNVTWTSAAGNEVFDSTAPNSGFGCAVGVETVGAGPSGTRLWSPSNSAAASAGYQIAIGSRPDSGGFLALI